MNILTYARDIDLKPFVDSLATPPVVLHSPVPSILRDRHLLFYLYLRQVSGFWIVCDSRDVRVIREPQLDPDRVTLSSEGYRHGVCDWNKKDQGDFQLKVARVPEFMDWEVLNGGFLSGPASLLADLCMALYTTMLIAEADATDQAVLNYLYHTILCGDPRYKITRPGDGMVAHGYAVSKGWVSREVWDAAAIQHQWDRV
jgi:hypothetical protein